MSRGLLAAIAVTQFGSPLSALAQPPGQKAPAERPAAQESAGRRGIVVGVGLFRSWVSGFDRQLDAGGFEAFLGWAFGRYAVAGWSSIQMDERDNFHVHLGAAVRAWPWAETRRLYLEGRAGYSGFGIAHLECDEEGDPCDDSRAGAVLGGAFGVELLSTLVFTIDARIGVDHVFLDDNDDHTMVAVGLTLNLY